MSRLSFTVEGDPIPWERNDSRSGRRYTAPRTREYQAKVRQAAQGAKAKPLDGRVRVALRFYRATARRCDWDNLAKSVCDALNGIAWGDDSQIADARVVKGIDRERPRVEVEVVADDSQEASPAPRPASQAASAAEPATPPPARPGTPASALAENTAALLFTGKRPAHARNLAAQRRLRSSVRKFNP